MNQIESQWDKLLKIKNTEFISKKNTVLDYGTGKGRVCFYLSYQTRCRSVGVEYDERIFSAAESNREHAVSGRRVSFELTGAEEYAVPTDVDRCYFLIRFL